MAIDQEEEEEVQVFSSENDKNNNLELLLIIYEKLVSFVSDKPNFKLRYYDLQPEEEEEENEEFRNSSIKSSYIHIKMEIEEIIEPLEIFLKLSENSSNILLKIQNEILPENGISNWINNCMETIEAVENNNNNDNNNNSNDNNNNDNYDDNNSNDNNSCWIIPKKLQFDQNSEIFNEIFSTLKEAIQIRNQLQNLIQDNFNILEFDKNNPNEIVLLPLERNFKAKVTMNTIIWTSETNETSLISDLNSIGSKYRSIIDCLKAQLEIILKQLSIS